MNVEEEVGKLKVEIQRLGQQQPDGSYKVLLLCLAPYAPSPGRSEPYAPPHFSSSSSVLPSPAWLVPGFLSTY
jgi:hypothetical protein